MMHTIALPIMQHCQWHHEEMTSAYNNFIKKIEVRIPESSYHITNNSLSFVL